ncbi:MAG: hypothetical protein C0406_04660, partial [Sideroxydans sp.]|nr:hypothetical protein [Sideroxydans sp.]
MNQELFSLLLCVGLAPIVFAGRNRLRLGNDFFFILFLSFAVLYLVIAPMITSLTQVEVASIETAAYPYLGVSVVSMFIAPLVLIYRLLINGKNCQHDELVHFDLSESKLIFLCIFFLAFEVAFTFIAVNNEMYVRRVGTEEIAEIVGGVNLATLAILRTHDVLALPVITLLAILLPTIKREMRSTTYFFSLFALTIFVIAFVAFAVVNSRALMVFLFLGLFFAYLFQKE